MQEEYKEIYLNINEKKRKVEVCTILPKIDERFKNGIVQSLRYHSVISDKDDQDYELWEVSIFCKQDYEKVEKNYGKIPSSMTLQDFNSVYEILVPIKKR